MEVDMLGSAIEAFQNMASLERLGFLSFGVLIGLVLGVIPGLGGLVGLSLLLPFTFNMDPFTATGVHDGSSGRGGDLGYDTSRPVRGALGPLGPRQRLRRLSHGAKG